MSNEDFNADEQAEKGAGCRNGIKDDNHNAASLGAE
jgi:hypothetical protein